jgi:hypothetical protein
MKRNFKLDGAGYTLNDHFSGVVIVCPREPLGSIGGAISICIHAYSFVGPRRRINLLHFSNDRRAVNT